MQLLQVALAHAACGLAVGDAPQQLPALLRVQAGRVGIPLVLHWAAPVPPWLLLQGQGQILPMSELAKTQNEAQQLPALLRVQAGRARWGPPDTSLGAPCAAMAAPAWPAKQSGCVCGAESALHDTCERIPIEALSNGTSLGTPCPTSPAPAWEVWIHPASQRWHRHCCALEGQHALQEALCKLLKAPARSWPVASLQCCNFPPQGAKQSLRCSGRQIPTSSRAAGRGGTYLIMRVHIVVTITCRRAGNVDALQVTTGQRQVLGPSIS